MLDYDFWGYSTKFPNDSVSLNSCLRGLHAGDDFNWLLPWGDMLPCSAVTSVPLSLSTICRSYTEVRFSGIVP